MKNTSFNAITFPVYILRALLLLSLLFGLSNCNKDDDNQTLPPATQTGAGTFACLVDGKLFIDKSKTFNCFYQLVEGEYYFGIGGTGSTEMPGSITIGTTAKTISEGERLQLTENIEGNAWGGGRFTLNINSSEFSNTNQTYSGELTITKLDFTNNIVSGTFFMDILNPYTNEIVKIRDGRFDTNFTQ